MDEENVLDQAMQAEEPSTPETQVTQEAPVESKEKDHGIQKRLGMLAKKYDRTLREQQAVIDRLTQHISQQQAPQNQYISPGQPDPVPDTEEDRIRKAVHYALTERERAEHAAKAQQEQQYVQNEYQRLQQQFDQANERYEDFDDKVRAPDLPFTTHMRDALLLVPNPADVAYRLADKREDLQRIANLRPLEQAREIYNLSMALNTAKEAKPAQQPAATANPLGQMRAAPIVNNSPNTAAAIRQRMKSGTWK